MDGAETESKFATWAKKRGINWSLARTQMQNGDIEAAAEQLRYAKANDAPEEVACVVFWLRLLEKRAAAMQVAA